MGLSESTPIQWVEPTNYTKVDFWNHTWYPTGILNLKRVVRSTKHKFESLKGPGAMEPQYYNVTHALRAVYRKNGELRIDMRESAKNGTFVKENVKVDILKQSQNGLKVKMKLTLIDSATKAKQEYTHTFWRYNFIIDI